MKKEIIKCPQCEAVSENEECDLMTYRREEEDKIVICCCESLASKRISK